MDLVAYRHSRGLTQAQAAKELGLKSKTSISMLESGLRDAPIELALQIQLWSGGAVPARDLVPDDKRPLLDQLQAEADRDAPTREAESARPAA